MPLPRSLCTEKLCTAAHSSGCCVYFRTLRIWIERHGVCGLASTSTPVNTGTIYVPKISRHVLEPFSLGTCIPALPLALAAPLRPILVGFAAGPLSNASFPLKLPALSADIPTGHSLPSFLFVPVGSKEYKHCQPSELLVNETLLACSRHATPKKASQWPIVALPYGPMLGQGVIYHQSGGTALILVRLTKCVSSIIPMPCGCSYCVSCCQLAVQNTKFCLLISRYLDKSEQPQRHSCSHSRLWLARTKHLAIARSQSLLANTGCSSHIVV